MAVFLKGTLLCTLVCKKIDTILLTIDFINGHKIERIKQRIGPYKDFKWL